VLLNPEEVLAANHPLSSRPHQPSSAREHIANSLSNLFLTCIVLLDLIQLKNSQDGSHPVLEAKLNNSVAHLTAWGNACGLNGLDNHDERLAYHGIRLDLEILQRIIE
jgi:hypothetical protein